MQTDLFATEPSPCPLRHPQTRERCTLPAGHEGACRLPDEHRCHARGCAMKVAPEMLMCRRHWGMVPRRLQLAVWHAYRPGQCDDKRPSREWLGAADAAIEAVAMVERSKS